MRTQRLEDLVRHWRTLLTFAESERLAEDATDPLRRGLDALAEALNSGNVIAMRRRFDDVRRLGLALESRLRREGPGGLERGPYAAQADPPR